MRMRNRVTPPEIAPNAAPFLPPTRAPTAVAIPAVAAIIKVSFSHDWRLPPPHNTTLASIFTSRKNFNRFDSARDVPGIFVHPNSVAGLPQFEVVWISPQGPFFTAPCYKPPCDEIEDR